jgi:hypothetical protein
MSVVGSALQTWRARCAMSFVGLERKSFRLAPTSEFDAFSTMHHIVQRMRKATGKVDHVEALAH